MPNYRFVYHECSGSLVRDEELRHFADLEAAKSASVEEARSIMAKEVARGSLCLSCWIVILDEEDFNLFTLHFGDAVNVVSQGHCDINVVEQAHA